MLGGTVDGDLTDVLAENLSLVPERKAAWEKVIAEADAKLKPSYEYLLAYMPVDDLKNLPVEQLEENVELAHEAMEQVPWADQISEELFLDAVLPYANVTEPRDPWRKEFMERYLPLVKNVKTPGEAALLLNETIFADYGVTYNTRRLRTDQSPKMTIDQGMATCTGLSIMLANACRAVGVPARIAGIPSWPGRGGNHTWTEIWDGRWHFVGACEPDPKGLNHGWFKGEAAGAIKDKPLNAIWAATWGPSDGHFPMVWNRGVVVYAENVTDRYKNTDPIAGPRLMVEVKRGGERVEAQVRAVNLASGRLAINGTSFGPNVDINRHIDTVAADGQEFLVVAWMDGTTVSTTATVSGDEVVRFSLDEPESVSKEMLMSLLEDRFSGDDAKRVIAGKVLDSIPMTDESMEMAWEAYKESEAHAAMKADFDAKKVTTSDRESPYLWRTVGEKPEGGWPLVIAMHGGGGTTQEFNDRQWVGMFERYYRDHPEAGGYVYLSLRAPNNEWNGFYDDPIGPLIEKLIHQFVVFADVDPDRVFATGASHGGYGAFVIGPKVPYRFAWVNASAAAPTPGETAGVNLRNLYFTWTIGSEDTAYGRADRCKEFDVEWKKWKAEYGGFEGGMRWFEGVGHGVNAQDGDITAEFMKAEPRNTVPKRVIWDQTDDRLKHFYWLEAPGAFEDGMIDATVDGNTITMTVEGLSEVALWLKPGLVDLSKPVTVKVNDQDPVERKVTPMLGTFTDGLESRFDLKLASGVRMVVRVE